MSTHIVSTTAPLLYAVRNNPDILWSGYLVPGQALGTPLELIQSPDENTFLAAADGKTGNYQLLPGAGAKLLAGDIYAYGTGLVIVRQTHIRTLDAPETVPALFSVYRTGQTGVLDWVANEAVYVGTHRLYNTIEYVCLQKHTTQVDWTPPATPNLWSVYTATEAWVVGKAYKVGDIVTYLGLSYQCLQAHTSQADWHPDAVPALWKKV